MGLVKLYEIVKNNQTMSNLINARCLEKALLVLHLKAKAAPVKRCGLYSSVAPTRIIQYSKINDLRGKV